MNCNLDMTEYDISTVDNLRFKSTTGTALITMTQFDILSFTCTNSTPVNNYFSWMSTDDVGPTKEMVLSYFNLDLAGRGISDCSTLDAMSINIEANYDAIQLRPRYVKFQLTYSAGNTHKMAWNSSNMMIFPATGNSTNTTSSGVIEVFLADISGGGPSNNEFIVTGSGTFSTWTETVILSCFYKETYSHSGVFGYKIKLSLQKLTGANSNILATGFCDVLISW